VPSGLDRIRPRQPWRNTNLVTLEIDDPVTTLVATTLVTHHDAAGVVTTSLVLQGGKQALFRRRLCNVVESRNRTEALSRCIWF